MTRDLAFEVAQFLRERGASTSTEIAIGVRARRTDVDAALLAGAFVEAPGPEGANPRARYWVAVPVSSGPVPSAPKGKSRAASMLAVLADGRKHSRDEIFRAAGRFFLTNNAAAELRSMGYDVQHGRDGGIDVYWLAPAGPGGGASLAQSEARAAASSDSASEAPAVAYPGVSSSALPSTRGELERADASSILTLFPAEAA